MVTNSPTSPPEVTSACIIMPSLLKLLTESKGRFLMIFGTVFQINVWRFLISIKEGETVSYSNVAQAIDKPKAFRAVANACGANNIAILVPCHRVLRGDGAIGGYRWGTSIKDKLIDLESKKPSI